MAEDQDSSRRCEVCRFPGCPAWRECVQGGPGSTCAVGVLGSELDPKGPAGSVAPGHLGPADIEGGQSV